MFFTLEEAPSMFIYKRYKMKCYKHNIWIIEIKIRLKLELLRLKIKHFYMSLFKVHLYCRSLIYHYGSCGWMFTISKSEYYKIIIRQIKGKTEYKVVLY